MRTSGALGRTKGGIVTVSIGRRGRGGVRWLLSVFVVGVVGWGAGWGVAPAGMAQTLDGDWLVSSGTGAKWRAQVVERPTAQQIELTNGLVRRTIQLSPNATTIDLEHLGTGESFLRAVAPEAIVELDGTRYPVGGLIGQPNLAYLSPAWLAGMRSDPAAFQFVRHETAPLVEKIDWKRVRHAPEGIAWPPSGISLTLWFRHPTEPGVEVAVRHDLYDGLPLLAKTVSVINRTARTVRLQRFVGETLRVVEAESHVDPSTEWRRPRLTVLTDFAFGGMSITSSNRTVHWETDPDYATQVNYERKTPALLVVRPPLGPDALVGAGERFDGFRTFLLLHDSDDRERQGLAVRRMYRQLAPWSLENPIMMHLTSTDPAVVYPAIDQAAECGFEMVILSFGSRFDMEDTSEENLRKFRDFRAYAAARGLELGGYSLLASRRISEEDDVINPRTGKTGGAIFNQSPCLGSRWGLGYFDRIRRFLEGTGFTLLEHDGSYPGDVCASTSHPGHRGLEDSQWSQYRQISEFYGWARQRGLYLNVPDNYFLAGSNKVAMGYRESNWSLPRAQQHIHARQNMFDGTWLKTPSMGWMFVPLVEYQGGGAAATIEPLREHLADYDQHMANAFGFGVQACYRGPRLYDSPETKAVVLRWVGWFKRYRAILESDIIHVRRANGRTLDAILHVNPALETRGLAMVYNPTDEERTEDLVFPLYYAGLEGSATVAQEDGPPERVTLDREARLRRRVTVPAHGYRWLVMRP